MRKLLSIILKKNDRTAPRPWWVVIRTKNRDIETTMFTFPEVLAYLRQIITRTTHETKDTDHE